MTKEEFYKEGVKFSKNQSSNNAVNFSFIPTASYFSGIMTEWHCTSQLSFKAEKRLYNVISCTKQFELPIKAI